MCVTHLIQAIKEKNPFVHTITNNVVANDSANGLLAIGASPFMSSAIAEMEEVALLCDAVVLNMGTLDDMQLTAMILAGKKANELGKPVVLDPVGVGATTYRKQATKKLLQEVKPTLIRGNAGEIAALAEVPWQAKGVDAGVGSADLPSIAMKLARTTGSFIALSGETDSVTDGTSMYLIKNGTKDFTKMTGSGCLLGCICGAFLAVASKQEQLASIVLACTMYALAGELVSEQLAKSAVGSFRTKLLDQLSQMTTSVVENKARVERVESK